MPGFKNNYKRSHDQEIDRYSKGQQEGVRLRKVLTYKAGRGNEEERKSHFFNKYCMSGLY